MQNPLDEQYPQYTTVRNWIASFKKGKFSIKVEDGSGRPDSMSTSTNSDAVYDMIFLTSWTKTDIYGVVTMKKTFMCFKSQK